MYWKRQAVCMSDMGVDWLGSGSKHFEEAGKSKRAELKRWFERLLIRDQAPDYIIGCSCGMIMFYT
jgi:hypothetical protein